MEVNDLAVGADQHAYLAMEIEHSSRDEQDIVAVAISSLAISDSPRVGGESAEHIISLAASQSALPPIIVHRPTMRVIDGMHRLEVAKLRGQDTIRVRFFDGSEADAFVLAVRANITHGLPLSLTDKRSAAERITASHPQWSDRMIAAATGLSAKTIAEIRSLPTNRSKPGNTRIGRDGRVRPIDAIEGRKVALRLMEQDPSLSLREIARIAGISPETVRDVRNRVYSGEDPLMRRQPSTRRAKAVEGRSSSAAVGQPSRSEVLDRLRADPALRLTDTGRTLLRLLYLHIMGDEEWDKIIQNVPAHCCEKTAYLARECSRVWLDVAERMEHRFTCGS